MLLFTIAASLISTFLFGLTPALQTTRLDLVSALKAADADSGGRRRLWGRNSIVAGQVALSLVLLIVSAVLLQGFRDELLQGPGFRTDHLWLTSFDTTPLHYTEDQTRRFYKDLLEQDPPGARSPVGGLDVEHSAAGRRGHRCGAGRLHVAAWARILVDCERLRERRLFCDHGHRPSCEDARSWIPIARTRRWWRW